MKKNYLNYKDKDNDVRLQLQTAVSQFSSSVSDTVNNFSDLKKEINSTFDPLKQSVEELSENIKKSSKGSSLFFWKKKKWKNLKHNHLTLCQWQIC